MRHCFIQTCLFFLSLMCSSFLCAQRTPALPRNIPPMDLPITTDKTSVLLFPAAIESVDRGSGEILTKKVKNINNVLKLKAASDSMKPSNLHVFTKDGQVYSFTVSYSPTPAHMTIDMSNTLPFQDGYTPVEFDMDRLNDEQVTRYAVLIAGLKPLRNSPRSKRIGEARLVVQGVYFINGVLFFQISLVNTAPIPYHLDFTRTYIRDRRTSRRTSIAEKEIYPIYTHVVDSPVTDSIQSTTLVLAFNQFTIADNKHFTIEVFEQNGDRALICKLKGKDILKAENLKCAPVTNTGNQ